MKELEREPKKLRKMSRKASWGEPIRLLTCDFCGWRGSELQTDREFEDNDDCDFEPSGWVLLCPECGTEVGFAASDPNEPEEWSVDSPWGLKPEASRAKQAYGNDFYIANKSRRYSADGDMWEDAGKIHVAEGDRTLCGRPVGDQDHGWTTSKSLGDIEAMIRREQEGFGSDEWGLCPRCVRSYERKTSQAKRPREVPPQDPDDPTDSALEYEVNTGFLDPYRGNISTPEGWGPKRGQPAPRLKKKDKSPVMPADMPIYARRRAMRKRAAEGTICPNCGADLTGTDAVGMWLRETEGYGGHINASQTDPDGIELSLDEDGMGAVRLSHITCTACEDTLTSEDFDDKGLWLLTK